MADESLDMPGTQASRKATQPNRRATAARNATSVPAHRADPNQALLTLANRGTCLGLLTDAPAPRPRPWLRSGTSQGRQGASAGQPAT